MRKKYQKIAILSACCISFYLGTQIVGETEASFSKQASIEKLTIKTAFVFPSTIHELKKQANAIAEHIEKSYERLNVDNNEISLQEAKERLAILSQLNEQVIAFYELYTELNRYNQQVREEKDHQHIFDFVIEGYKHVDKLMKAGGISSYARQFTDIQASLKEQIDRLEKQKLQQSQEELEKQETQESLENDLHDEPNNREIENTREEGQGMEKNEESDTSSK